MFHCDPYADRTHICNLNLHQNKESGFARVNLVEVIHPQSFYCCPFQGRYSEADHFCCKSSIAVIRYMAAADFASSFHI